MASDEPQRPEPSTSDKAPINLLRGWPNPSLLPTALIRSAAQEALSDPTISAPGLLYGPDPGYEPLRESIADWLTDFYHTGDQGEGGKKAVTADRISITGGASQNLGCILNACTDPSYTRCVWVVAPAYFLAFGIFEDAGLEMRAVPEDEDGVDIDYLRAEIDKVEKKAQREGKTEPHFKRDRSWAKVYKHIVYCVPTFANPSSKTMTLQRRKDLVQLARESDALVVCDDVYDFLQWPSKLSTEGAIALKTAHLPRLVDIDRTLPHPIDATPPSESHIFRNVCSNGSFSKLAGPGLRVGWCEGTPAFAYGISQVGTTKSGGAPSQLTSTYVNILLEKKEMQGWIREVLVPAYGRRYGKLMRAIEKYLIPLGFSLPTHNAAMKDVVGGYFTWLTLPSSLSFTAATSPAEILAERCQLDANVIIAPGKIFEVPNDNEHDGVNFAKCIRLCWSWEDEEKLADGVEGIAKVAEAMIEDVQTGDKKEGWIGKGYVLVENERQKKGADVTKGLQDYY